MNNSLEKALRETWKNKEKFYEDNKHLSIREILEKIEGRKYSNNNLKKEKIDEEIVIKNGALRLTGL
jgi:chromatin remodeling complex protein RSC6